MEVAATTGAGGVQVQLDLGLEAAAPKSAAAPMEREAKRRRVHAVPGPPAGAGGGGAGRRGRRRRVQAATAVQRLFQACRHVFRGPGPGTVPKPAEVQLLRDMLDRMRPEDVGLSPDLRYFRTRDATQGIPTITHTTIYKCPNFSMVILFLPRNAVIPLHNHPGMTVFSKLLLGTMHIKSYDWVDPEPDPSVSTCSSSSSSDGQLRLAKLVVDDVFRAPCDTSVLYPTTGGNMHRFTAIAPCAILDILGPPYSIEEDRDCTYYTDIPYTHHSSCIVWRAICPLRIGLPKQAQPAHSSGRLAPAVTGSRLSSLAVPPIPAARRGSGGASVHDSKRQATGRRRRRVYGRGRGVGQPAGWQARGHSKSPTWRRCCASLRRSPRPSPCSGLGCRRRGRPPPSPGAKQEKNTADVEVEAGACSRLLHLVAAVPRQLVRLH